jgi:hypothetical protein
MQKINNAADYAEFSSGQVLHKTVTNTTYTATENKTIIGILPLGSASWTAIGVYARTGTGYDTHLSSDGTSGGTAVSSANPYFASFTSVTITGTAILLVG